jgi:hypothetical protein
VDILDLVATNASCRHPFVNFTNMTGGTAHFGMRTHKCELGFGVVKRLYASPGFRRVAGLAGGQAAFVGVVPVVTLGASRGRVSMGFPRAMTVRACCCSVPPDEEEIGQGVVEGLCVEADDVELPALVIGMAMLARDTSNRTVLTVKALVSINVVCNILMAGETEAGLLGFSERSMTILAFLFEFCMAFDQWTRRHQPIEESLAPARRRPQGDQTREQEQDDQVTRHDGFPMFSTFNRGGLR